MFDKKTNWGGKRECAGRKKTCLNKVPFNRRIDENVLNILKTYAKKYNLTETEALESAIILQTNVDKLKGDKTMKIAIPTTDGKLCAHYGHCETFSFVEIDNETKEIKNIETAIPEEGITCQSANWIASKGVNVVLVGGIGARPLDLFSRNGVKLVIGCPEIEIKEVVEKFLNNELNPTGINVCGHDEKHNCHGGHGEGHHHGC